ncbi:TRAP transporter small permease [Corynebacterium hylobatis]|uniref:TRAP transporter small permease n=1 Tax=Corynebacterium hylobatis TaxID=1859290 RepID=A0A430HZ76_9CORY|nr:TRAP transporter small permease [Corynebacterium hylobatis]RSZ63822.1 TRAP transporter small permease [Corynebacterium hylobatis]
MLQVRPQSRSPLSGLLKIVHGGSSALLVVSGVALSIMVLLVSYDVLMRNLLGSAMTGVAEYVSEWLMPATILFALAYTERKNEHIRVTIIEDSIKGGPQKTLRVLGQLTSVAVALVLTWSSYQLALDSFGIRETVPMGTELLAVWPVKVAVFAGWLWLSGQTIANLVAIVIPDHVTVPASEADLHQPADEDNLPQPGNEGGPRA